MPAKSKKRSDYSLSREITQRLAHAGVRPFKDDRIEYVRVHGKREGDVYVFGPRLRSHRMFSMKRRAEVESTAQDFAAFAAGADQKNWRVWTVHYPSRKTELDALVEDLQNFNRLINNVFSERRKRKDCNFYILLLGIHIEFDHTTGLFDIHAHFVCEMPADNREEVRRRLMMAFSRTDLTDEPLRTAQGFARYAEKTLKLDHVVTWPIEALQGVWPLVDHKFQYLRTGGAFAAWRKKKNETTTPTAEQEEKRRKKKNRRDTRYEGNAWDYCDQPQVRKKWKLGGELLDGTLYLSAPTATPKRTAPSAPPSTYSSAPGTTTQSKAILRDRKFSENQRGTSVKVQVDTGIKSEPGNFALAGVRGSMSAKVYGCKGIGPVSVTPSRRTGMTKNYITRKEVHAAADRVNASGRKPNPYNVRKETGHGHYSTIERYLEDWKPRDQLDELPPIPEGLTSDVSSLLGDLWSMALTAAADQFAAQVAKATADTTEAQVAAVNAGERADVVSAEMKKVLKASATVEKTLKERNRQLEQLKVYTLQLETQIAQKEAQLETLEKALNAFAPTKRAKTKEAV